MRVARFHSELARDIHGTLGQYAAAIGMIVSRLENRDTNAKAALERLGEITRELAATTRRIETKLHPALITQCGLKSALEDRLSSVFMPSGLDCPDDEACPAGLEALVIYRMVECLIEARVTASLRVACSDRAVDLTAQVGMPRVAATPPVIGLDDWIAATGASMTESDGSADGTRTVSLTIPRPVGRGCR